MSQTFSAPRAFCGKECCSGGRMFLIWLSAQAKPSRSKKRVLDRRGCPWTTWRWWRSVRLPREEAPALTVWVEGDEGIAKIHLRRLERDLDAAPAPFGEGCVDFRRVFHRKSDLAAAGAGSG